MFDPVSAEYKVTIRNSGDEVAMSDDDLKEVVKDYLEEHFGGILVAVEVERTDTNV